MKFTTEDGKEYAFHGEYHKPKDGETFLMDTGKVVTCGDKNDEYGGHGMSIYVRAIVHPVLPPVVEHTFGGIVFEETGEVRQAVKGEWRFHYTSVPCYTECSVTTGKYQIIRPVRLKVK